MNRVVRVRQEGTNVLLIIDGVATEMPWEAALELGRALLHQGHRAEEIAKHEQVIEDQALLTRIGAPFGVAVDRRIQQEAAKEAVNNTRLRRLLPGGVKATEFVGAPSIQLLGRVTDDRRDHRRAAGRG